MRRTAVIVAVLLLTALPGREAGAITLSGQDVIADVMFGTSSTDKLSGASGNDVIFGKTNPASRRKRVGGRARRVASPDLIMGGDGSDDLLGGPGPDRIVGGEGTEYIIDEDGTPKDSLRAEEGLGSILVSADGAKDTVDCGGDGTALVDVIDTVTNCTLVVAEAGTGTFNSGFTWNYGTAASDVLAGGAGNFNIVIGLGGIDQISGSGVRDFVSGGPGADLVDGAAGGDLLFDDDGTPGDILSGGTENDRIYSADGASDTILCGAGASDVVFADPDDVINAGAGCETVYRADGAIDTSPEAIA